MMALFGLTIIASLTAKSVLKGLMMGCVGLVLACIGIDIIEAIRYPDHHDYGMLEMQYISERAISKEVVAMVTTGKDAVKIPTEFIYFNREMPLYILNMDIKITEGREVFEKTILNAIQKETNE